MRVCAFPASCSPGRRYFVADYDGLGDTAQAADCPPDYVARRDHTLEILAVLHRLLGLNKSATDIRATPFVQVVP
ncbi:MAG: hypothetical protein HW417_2056 [Steroidobacteraceae bacterium]|nr:hypothetical protein [Steroidobacteraceae bacterium]